MKTYSQIFLRVCVMYCGMCSVFFYLKRRLQMTAETFLATYKTSFRKLVYGILDV